MDPTIQGPQILVRGAGSRWIRRSRGHGSLWGLQDPDGSGYPAAPDPCERPQIHVGHAGLHGGRCFCTARIREGDKLRKRNPKRAIHAQLNSCFWKHKQILYLPDLKNLEGDKLRKRNPKRAMHARCNKCFWKHKQILYLPDLKNREGDKLRRRNPKRAIHVRFN